MLQMPGKGKDWDYAKWDARGAIKLYHNRSGQPKGLSSTECQKQIRPMRMSNLLITYVLHHRALHTEHNRYVMRQMSNAADHMFQTGRILETMILFGQKVLKGGGRSLLVRRKNPGQLYDNYTETYPYDEFITHMHYTE